MRYANVILNVIFFLYIGNIQAQKITYNQINFQDAEIRAVKQLFESYITSNPEQQNRNLYWNSDEQKLYRNYDFLESEFTPSLYMGFPVHVLSIKFTDELCEIKAQFSYCKEDGSPYVLAIVNYYAKKENGKYVLYNALSVNKIQWSCTTVGMVDFYYPKYHNLDYGKAQKLNDFISQICSNFELRPKPFEYYLADDFDEIQRLKGFDYYMGMGGNNQPRGKAAEGKVYCGGLGEYYIHEVFHVQIDKHFPKAHFWISEGVATLLGGSRGKDLKWHIHRTNQYLQNHPEIDLNNLLQLKNVDGTTSYHYVLGGLITQKLFERGGWNLLKSTMQKVTTDEEYYRMIETYLGIKKSELNNYLRKQLQLVSAG